MNVISELNVTELAAYTEQGSSASRQLLRQKGTSLLEWFWVSMV